MQEVVAWRALADLQSMDLVLVEVVLNTLQELVLVVVEAGGCLDDTCSSMRLMVGVGDPQVVVTAVDMLEGCIESCWF